MGKLTTPEERAAELRARLSGQVPNRTSRRKNRVASTLANPMFAAALHAASRDANGAELSPMEARLVRMLKTFATDEEVAGYGKMYTETKDQAGKGTLSGTIFSGVALNMNADTPYTDEDMVADAKAMASDFLAMPENKIIDITTIDTECTDSTEYMEALTGAGNGVTVFSAPDIEEKKSEPVHAEKEETGSVTPNVSNRNDITSTVAEIKLVLKRFKCHRKQDDSVFGPKNEIYWAVASGSDVRDEKNFKTDEYGSVESGDVRQMDLVYFQGAIQYHFAGHIECWEADDSAGGFYNKLVQTLKDISKFSIDAAVRANETDDWGDEYGATGKAVAILSLVALCGTLVAALLEWLTNDDDLVFRRELAFTYPALVAWSKRSNGELSFMFDGGHQGKHELWITCQATPRSKGVLAGWKVISGTGHSSPVVPGRALDGISLANFNNELCGVFRELNGRFYWTKYDGQSKKWSSPQYILFGQVGSWSRPAVATLGDRIFCLWRGFNDKLYCTSTQNGASWSLPALAAGEGGATSDGPALCGYQDRLVAVHRGTNNRVYVNYSTDGVTWTAPGVLNSSASTDKSPALFSHWGFLYCFIRNASSGSLCVSEYDRGSWTNFRDLGSRMDSAPQVALSSDGTMIVGYVSVSGSHISFKEYDSNGQWRDALSWNNVSVTGSPGMANWDGALWVYAGMTSL